MTNSSFRPQAVSLHDSPSKALFGKTSRAFRHGCIQVQHQPELGKVLLLDDRNNPIDVNAFDYILAKGEAATLQFKKSVPAIDLCSTTHVIEGKVRFTPDLYQRERLASGR